MEAVRPFQYLTLLMSKRHTVTLRYGITVYNDRFDYMDGIMRALARKKTQWKEDLFCTMKFVQQMLCKYHAEVTPRTGILLISACILTPFRQLRLFTIRNKAIDVHSADGASSIS